MEEIKLRGHHLRVLYKCAVEKIPLEIMEERITMQGYGKEHASRAINLISKIINEEGIKIKLIAGKTDDLCKGCRCYDPTCCIEGYTTEKDRNCITSFNFSVGETYASEEIVGRIKKMLWI